MCTVPYACFADELQLKNGLECGGAYLKLLAASTTLSRDGFGAETPYIIMFGPDKCGDTNVVRFILKHTSSMTGETNEVHLVEKIIPVTEDRKTHLYTLIIGTDNTVQVLIDNVLRTSANLLSETDFTPLINPPRTIDDPEATKPSWWVDEKMMLDPSSSKPVDWDEDAPEKVPDASVNKPGDWLDEAPTLVSDSTAKRPDDWNDYDDGEWEPPLVPNPDCPARGCVEWIAPMISNPEYMGKWEPHKIKNPDYVGAWAPGKVPNPDYLLHADLSPFALAPIGGIGIELWTLTDGILFDNILLAADPAIASGLAARTFLPRRKAEDEPPSEEPKLSYMQQLLLKKQQQQGAQDEL